MSNALEGWMVVSERKLTPPWTLCFIVNSGVISATGVVKEDGGQWVLINRKPRSEEIKVLHPGGKVDLGTRSLPPIVVEVSDQTALALTLEWKGKS